MTGLGATIEQPLAGMPSGRRPATGRVALG